MARAKTFSPLMVDQMKLCEDKLLQQEGILAVNPGCSFYSGTGWAYFEYSKLKHCGLVRAYPCRRESAKTILEMLNNFSMQWETVREFTIWPNFLCLGSTVNYEIIESEPNNKTLDGIYFLNGTLTEKFKPHKLLRPATSEWKRNKPNDRHHLDITSSLDVYDKKPITGQRQL